VLGTEDGAPYDHLPGQWLKLYLPNGIERDYSIASAPSPEHPGQIELVVTRVEGGPGSAELHRLEVGSTLESLGPNGLFLREEEHLAAPALYVGTGTGLAPLRAMLMAELARPSGKAQVVLFGARREEDLLFREELEGWAREGTHPLRADALTAPTLLGRGVAATCRRIWGSSMPPCRAPHVYICGLSRMITEARAILRKELLLDRKQVHSERYD
jgi:CDP-4-dehydro-6-deoxyglucose reductase